MNKRCEHCNKFSYHLELAEGKWLRCIECGNLVENTDEQDPNIVSAIGGCPKCTDG